MDQEQNNNAGFEDKLGGEAVEKLTNYANSIIAFGDTIKMGVRHTPKNTAGVHITAGVAAIRWWCDSLIEYLAELQTSEGVEINADEVKTETAQWLANFKWSLDPTASVPPSLV